MNTTTPYRGLWLIVFIFSALVLLWNLPNLGGNHTPRSLFSWAAISIGVTWCWGCAWLSRQIQWDKYISALLLPPIAVMLWAALGPDSAFENYGLQASMALLLGALWVSGLAQLKLSSAQWLHIAIMVLASSVLLVLTALSRAEYFGFQALYEALPVEMSMKWGGFQQPNNFASFLVTSLVFLFWCYVRYANEDRGNSLFLQGWHKPLLWAGTFAIGLMIFLIGSRTGYVSMLLCSLLLTAWVLMRHPHHRNTLVGWLAAIGLAILVALNAEFFGFDAKQWISSRLADLPNGTGTVVRKDMWMVTASLWWHAPLLGHGLGSFTDVFTNEFQHLTELGYGLTYTDNLTHPHNEPLLWLAETGALGATLILGPWLAWVWHCARKGTWTQQLGWLAVLAPITLHCMTEYPLHGSGAHWFLLGLVLAANLSLDEEPQHLQHLSRPLWLSGVVLVSTVGLLCSLFMLHTGWLSYKMMQRLAVVEQNPIDFLEKWADSKEMRHPILGQSARDNYLILTANIIFQMDDEDLKKDTCDKMQNLHQRYKSLNTGNILAQCK